MVSQGLWAIWRFTPHSQRSECGVPASLQSMTRLEPFVAASGRAHLGPPPLALGAARADAPLLLRSPARLDVSLLPSGAGRLESLPSVMGVVTLEPTLPLQGCLDVDSDVVCCSTRRMSLIMSTLCLRLLHTLMWVHSPLHRSAYLTRLPGTQAHEIHQHGNKRSRTELKILCVGHRVEGLRPTIISRTSFLFQMSSKRAINLKHDKAQISNFAFIQQQT